LNCPTERRESLSCFTQSDHDRHCHPPRDYVRDAPSALAGGDAAPADRLRARAGRRQGQHREDAGGGRRDSPRTPVPDGPGGAQWPLGTGRSFSFTFQHVGSSYTQLADQEANFGLISSASPRPPGAARFIPFGAPTIGEVRFDAELPDYQIGNLRFGVQADQWEAAAFINNLWDERAFLSIDRERGRSARVGYLTNQPRTYGVTLRYSF